MFLVAQGRSVRRIVNVSLTYCCREFRNALEVPARNADPIATATTKCDLMRSARNKETKPS
jgi:hypothetical protein